MFNRKAHTLLDKVNNPANKPANRFWYRIAGNFRGVLIFVIFVTNLTGTKFCTPRKFATVGKGRLEKSRRKCAHNRDCVQENYH